MKRDHLLDTIISIAVFIALEVLSIVLISNNSVVQHSQVASTIQTVNNFFLKNKSSLQEFSGLRQENAKLAEENAILRLRLEELSLQIESAPLPDSAMVAQSRYDFLAAKVINNTVNRQHNFLILDKGSLDGVTEGMGVVTSRGVIGVITTCDERYCKVKSLLDVDQKISGKLLKDNNPGLVNWGGRSTSTVYMTEIPTHTDIAPGDTVVTSGYSSIFPQGIPIGKVDVAKSDGVSVVATLSLFENFHSLQYVYIVKDADMEAIKELEESK